MSLLGTDVNDGISSRRTQRPWALRFHFSLGEFVLRTVKPKCRHNLELGSPVTSPLHSAGHRVPMPVAWCVQHCLNIDKSYWQAYFCASEFDLKSFCFLNCINHHSDPDTVVVSGKTADLFDKNVVFLSSTASWVLGCAVTGHCAAFRDSRCGWALGSVPLLAFIGECLSSFSSGVPVRRAAWT